MFFRFIKKCLEDGVTSFRAFLCASQTRHAGEAEIGGDAFDRLGGTRAGFAGATSIQFVARPIALTT